MVAAVLGVLDILLIAVNIFVRRYEKRLANREIEMARLDRLP